MTPAELLSRLAALRQAGALLRRRPGREVLDVLADLVDRWRDPDCPERRRLERELPCVSGLDEATLREGLVRGLGPWSGDALRELAWRELGRGAELALGHPSTAVLLAGILPLPTLLGVISPLVLRSPVLARATVRDPVTPGCVRDSLSALDPELARALAVVRFPSADAECMHALLSAECVVATGSDATLDSVATRLAPGAQLVRHGHAVSVALLGAHACEGRSLERAAAGLALDTALWDQLGCLSPVAVYAVGSVEVARNVAAALAEALEDLERRLPRGALDAAAEARTSHERAGAELRAAAGRAVVLHAGDSYTVVCEPDATPRPSPLHRFLRVHPVAGEQGLEAALAPLAPHLAGVALAGFGDGSEALGARLRAWGATRVCAPGELQSPPLDWPRDRLPVLAAALPGP